VSNQNYHQHHYLYQKVQQQTRQTIKQTKTARKQCQPTCKNVTLKQLKDHFTGEHCGNGVPLVKIMDNAWEWCCKETNNLLTNNPVHFKLHHAQCKVQCVVFN